MADLISFPGGRAVQPPPPEPAKPVDPNEFVVNEHRPGMRARSRNFSYKESDLSGSAMDAAKEEAYGDAPATEKPEPLEVK